MAKSSAVTYSALSEEPLDVEALQQKVQNLTAGAVVTFVGAIRNHDHGQTVTGIDFSFHPTSAEILAQLVDEQAQTPQVQGVAAVHRVGRVALGETALMVAVSAEHRAEAFQVASALVDQIKARLPMWKHQYFANGTDEWVGLE